MMTICQPGRGKPEKFITVKKGIIKAYSNGRHTYTIFIDYFVKHGVCAMEFCIASDNDKPEQSQWL
ncbi:hypothetical protein AAZX31_20G008000 [Glycine max]